MDLGLTEKVVCVTGSTRGIGRAIAEAFLREGARVVVTGRTKEDLDRTCNEWKVRWGAERVLAFQGDLTRDSDIGNCIESVHLHWNGLDILVANIGSGRGTVGWESRRDEWERLLDMNLVAGSLMVNRAVPLLRAQGGGSITFISSIAGLEALPAPVAYVSAKAGLLALSKMFSRLLAPDHIRVNAVAPGNILFPGGVWERKLTEDRERVSAYVNAEVPLRRMGQPEEVADAVVFLASARASFITGACLVLDGGQSHAW